MIKHTIIITFLHNGLLWHTHSGNQMQRDYIGYIVALICTLIGAYVSYYYYNKSIQQKQPLFAVDTIPSTIYDTRPEMRVPLRVTRENGQQLTKSVYAANHTFWNAGNTPILQEDILTPIRISLTAKDSELLAVSIVSQSRKVVACSVIQDSPHSFQLTFRILEQDDGCLIRVFYAGPQSPHYKTEGEIVGVRKLNVSGESIFEYIERTKDNHDYFKNILGYVPIILLWLAIFVLSTLYVRAVPLARKKISWLFFALIILCAIITGMQELISSRTEFNTPTKPNNMSWTTAHS